MEFDRTGIILYTKHYEKCVEFYAEIIGLPKLFVTKDITCFEFGASYLMVEFDDEYDGKENKPERIKTCLRMNVSNVRELADKLIDKNIEVDFQEHSWGTVAKFFDPDGNLCAFKDSEKFNQQVNDYNANESC